MINKHQKISRTTRIIILTILPVLVFLAYNKNKVLARDTTEIGMRTIICEETQANENILEIPIGRAADQAEYIGSEIANEMGILIENANQINEKVGEMPWLTERLDISNCEPECGVRYDVPRGCTSGYTCDYQNRTHSGAMIEDEGWSQQDCQNLPYNLGIDRDADYAIFQYTHIATGAGGWCNIKVTSGGGASGWCNIKAVPSYSPEPCQPNNQWPSADIEAAQSEINSFSQTIKQSQQKIADLTAQMEQAFEKLEKSRDRLADCVIRPYEQEALEQGEKTGVFLLNCQSIMNAGIIVHSYLGNNFQELQEGCYNDEYCEFLEMENKPLPYPPAPCADDFYCCY